MGRVRALNCWQSDKFAACSRACALRLSPPLSIASVHPHTPLYTCYHHSLPCCVDHFTVLDAAQQMEAMRYCMDAPAEALGVQPRVEDTDSEGEEVQEEEEEGQDD
jgi:hypothetical protein